ncbi:ABC transporter permease [Aeromicrobium sp.]|uniref:ABC transporter permease n=1 Tax=Aeromicrobium sp. TaxID=1871063 RepID=UPI0030C33430
MSNLTIAAHDSRTMLRRNLRHMQRYPSLTLMIIGIPLVFLLMFVYVFGGTMGTTLGVTGEGRSAYVEYLVPGILMIAIAGVVQGTAISVAMDMTEGIVDRFRTMSISRGAVLGGHVIGSMIQSLLTLTVVMAVAILIGFRPSAGPLEWFAAIGVLAMITFAITWLAVALGMVADSVETASNTPMPLMLLPFFGSGFVPTDTMPAGLRLFAEYQPFTPFIETIRGLLTNAEVGNSFAHAVAWSIVITLLGYVWAMRSYERGAERV